MSQSTMSVSRSKRDRTQSRPYQHLPQAMALLMTSVVKRLVSVARSWNENAELSAQMVELVNEVQYVNTEFAKLIGVVAKSSLSIYSEASASTQSFASGFTSSSFNAYHSPSSVDLLTSNVDAMLVDQHISTNPSLEHLSDFVMGDAEATQRLIVQIEAMLSLRDLMPEDNHISMRVFNQFNRTVSGLVHIAPVLDDLIKAGKNLLILTDFAGPGWVTVLQDTISSPVFSPSGSSSATAAPSSPTSSIFATSSTSPASRMTLGVFNKLVTWHNENALETLQKDVALGKKVRLIEACSSCLYFSPCSR